MCYEINAHAVGKNIYCLRKQAGMTQAQLAELIGISPAFLSRVECGNKAMSLPVLYRTAKVLHVSCDSILSGESKQTSIETICFLLADCPEAFVHQIELIIRSLKSFDNPNENGSRYQ